MKKSFLKSFLIPFFCVLPVVSGRLDAAPAPKTLPRAAQIQIESLLRHPGIQNAHIGIAIVALGEAKTPAQFPAAPYDGGAQPLLFGRDAGKRFLPASNFKLFTAAWVLHQLGPTQTFVTRAIGTQVLAMRAGSWPSGTPYPGVVTLYGDGDPSLSSSDLAQLAKEVVAQPSGALIVRASDALFPLGSMGGEEGGGRYPDGWTLDDAIWYYGAPVSSLAINRNQVDISVVGGEKIGDAALIFGGDEAAYRAYQEQSKTASANPIPLPNLPFPVFAPVVTGAKTDLHWTRGDKDSPLGPVLTISGTIEAGKIDSEGVAVPDPRGWTQTIFADDLRQNGVQVVEPDGFYGQKDAKIVAEHQSPPVATLLQRFLKSSDNLYGEMLLRRAAVSLPLLETQSPQIASSGLAARAHGAMLSWLRQSGVPTSGIRFSDGSGLSRYNLVTPIAVAKLLGAAQKIEGGAAFYDALPIAGVDGTLKNRMKGSAAQGNVRAKTGTFSVANCLSGYVTTRDGQRLAVSILTGGVEDGELARRWEGRVFAALANARFGKK